jgi:hypothetical protein
MAYPTVLFVNIPTSAVQVTLASSNGQSFDIQNTGTGLLVSAVGAFYIIGY